VSQNPINPGPSSVGGTGREPDALLEAYLDGELRGEALAGFERRLASDAGLRAEVELQRTIDGSLGKLFGQQPALAMREGMPSVAGKIGETPGVTGRAGGRGQWIFRAVLGLAATFLLATAGLWYAGIVDPSVWLGGTPTPKVRLVSLDKAYRQQEASQFQPDFKCEDDKQFADWVNGRYGQELLVRPIEGLEVTGWTYYATGSVLSPQSALLLAKVDGKDVVVVMDRKRHDRSLTVPPDSGLHMFKRIIGGIVLYEVTPLSTEKVLPRFYDPKKQGK
jgi:hypothetical protein